jgi:hypothetical protein
MENQKFLQNRPDEEGLMILIQLKTLSEYSQKISSLISTETELPSWIQSKIAVAQRDLDDIYHFLDGLNTFKNNVVEPTMALNTMSNGLVGGISDDSEDLSTFDEFIDKTENPKVLPAPEMGDEEENGDIPEFSEFVGSSSMEDEEEDEEESEEEDEKE